MKMLRIYLFVIWWNEILGREGKRLVGIKKETRINKSTEIKISILRYLSLSIAIFVFRSSAEDEITRKKDEESDSVAYRSTRSANVLISYWFLFHSSNSIAVLLFLLSQTTPIWIFSRHVNSRRRRGSQGRRSPITKYLSSRRGSSIRNIFHLQIAMRSLDR